jgi:mono/diheme cytochrome c family protein
MTMRLIYSRLLISLMVLILVLVSLPPNTFAEDTDDDEEECSLENLSDEDKSQMKKGKRIYSISCVLCHGSEGRGDGPASVFIGPYSHPRPNDFTRGVFKYRTTESGDLPTLTDLMRTIRYGIPGYMPSFKHLGEDGIRQVAFFIVNQFVQAILPDQAMEALNPERKNTGVTENQAKASSASDSGEAARIEVYKGITVILNDIAKNSLAEAKNGKNPESSLKIYNQIIPLLNNIVGNLETNNLLLTNEGPAVNNAETEASTVAVDPLVSQSDAVVGNDKVAEDRLSTAVQDQGTLSGFSTFFIGEGDLVWD